ncbi:hypothetical protein ABTZ93_18240 [Streptomyces sp. NPDC097941]
MTERCPYSTATAFFFGENRNLVAGARLEDRGGPERRAGSGLIR